MYMAKVIINKFLKKISSGIDDILTLPDNVNFFYSKEYISSMITDSFKFDIDVHSKTSNDIIFTFTIKFEIDEKNSFIFIKYSNKHTFKNKQIIELSDIINFEYDNNLQEKVKNLICNEFDIKIKESRIPLKYNPL